MDWNLNFQFTKNEETSVLTTIKQESLLKKAYVVDILNRIGE